MRRSESADGCCGGALSVPDTVVAEVSRELEVIGTLTSIMESGVFDNIRHVDEVYSVKPKKMKKILYSG